MEILFSFLVIVDWSKVYCYYKRNVFALLLSFVIDVRFLQRGGNNIHIYHLTLNFIILWRMIRLWIFSIFWITCNIVFRQIHLNVILDVHFNFGMAYGLVWSREYRYMVLSTSVFRRWHANEKLTGSKLLMHTSIAQSCHSTFCNPLKCYLPFLPSVMNDVWLTVYQEW